MQKRKMRILSGLLALTLFSGCAARQAGTEPTSVNQAMLIDQAGQGQEDYSFPARFTGYWEAQEGKLTIRADAEVTAEQGTALPTAAVEPRRFTQQDVDKLLQVFLKGEKLYSFVLTKQELQKSLDYVNSSEWQSDPDAPQKTPEQLEKRRQELIAYYTGEMEKAPEEKPVVTGFSDSGDPNGVSGSATVDGETYEVFIRNCDGDWVTEADIIRTDFKYGTYRTVLPGISGEEAADRGNALMAELGLDNMVLDDVQKDESGVWRLYYVPTVNGYRIPGIREDTEINTEDYTGESYQYSYYARSEEKNPDTVWWYMETIQICVGQDGILSFSWPSPGTVPDVKETTTALLPFDGISAIASTMLPVVIIGPSEANSLVELDKANGDETHMDVDITKVSLSLMRIRDKGSLQGTIVPVWDFWGTWDWYDVGDGTLKKGAHVTTQPMLTLNAIDGNVVSRQFGY